MAYVKETKKGSMFGFCIGKFIVQSSYLPGIRRNIMMYGLESSNVYWVLVKMVYVYSERFVPRTDFGVGEHCTARPICENEYSQ